MLPDDSTGKRKGQDAHTRSWLLTFSFLIGMCIGIMVAARLYISIHKPSFPITTLSSSSSVQTLSPITSTSNEGFKIQGSNLQCHDQDLLDILQKVAPDFEVLVAISNYNLVKWGGMLNVFIETIQRVGIKNYIIVAIDKELYEFLLKKGVNVWYKDVTISESQKDTGSNHAVSALKFGILKYFLQCGYSVLLSDVDVAVIQNPFYFLYRDRDVEGMTDGFDDRTAYGFIDGFDDPTMGWARFAQAVKHFNLNSGLFYLRANERTVELMQRLETRLSKEKYWDQTAFNEEIFFLSHGEYRSPDVSVRVMDYTRFMNSKVLFKDVRHRAKQPPMPAMVHINYHPDKLERMKAVIEFYLDNNVHALERFPGGSEPGS
eukprot:TRINITY_DN711_c0_g1_i6.p1 TRINITY_DN711_c0_g1~~TRINITY_DN711_c0_g1_i6.p1  ORF type:complete len:385 (-),score=39.05 TRINITY_DN711_c0_g1_i6:233-1357(-)